MTKTADKPAKLSAEAQRLIDDLSREYCMSDAAAGALLRVAGECLDRMRSAQQLIRQHGQLIKGRDGLRANPAVKMENDARAHFLAALKALHLDVEPLGKIGRPSGPPGDRDAD